MVAQLIVLLPCSKKVPGSIPSLGSFCMEFACSPCAYVGSYQEAFKDSEDDEESTHKCEAGASRTASPTHPGARSGPQNADSQPEERRVKALIKQKLTQPGGNRGKHDNRTGVANRQTHLVTGKPTWL
ncbi:hypothetical protein ILYODFUR_012504 [Ilyodon furcidens]|uniref:Uncharacterized protein n=1 Tax=Ilyodon furcidens TaxID=33524 RepID=A0ABV0VDE0_9TELE